MFLGRLDLKWSWGEWFIHNENVPSAIRTPNAQKMTSGQLGSSRFRRVSAYVCVANGRSSLHIHGAMQRRYTHKVRIWRSPLYVAYNSQTKKKPELFVVNLGRCTHNDDKRVSTQTFFKRSTPFCTHFPFTVCAICWFFLATNFLSNNPVFLCQNQFDAQCAFHGLFNNVPLHRC